MSDNRIELRSEKVRKIVGQIPPVLLRNGIAIILLISILMFTCASFIPYSVALSLPTQLYCTPQYDIIKAPANGLFLLQETTEEINQDQCLGRIIEANDSIIPINSMAAGKLVANCHNGALVEEGNILFIVVPEDTKSYYSIIHIPSDKISQISLGKKVDLEFYTYPKETYGTVEGEIIQIDSLQENLTFRVMIALPYGLTSSNGYIFPYSPSIEGQARINQSTQSFLHYILKSL